MNNEMYLRRRNKVIVDSDVSESYLSDAYLVAFQKNIASLGYTFSDDVLKAVKRMNKRKIGAFHTSIVKTLMHLVGAHVKYEPMYPNFPKQVADADEVELYINAQLHYVGAWLGLRLLPQYEKLPREALTEKVNLKTIDLGTLDDFNSIFTLLVQSKISLSDTDKKDIEWFITNYKNSVIGLLPKEIPNKENLVVIAKHLLKNTDIDAETLGKYFSTATDVLRLIVAMSDGDVSLAKNSRIRSFKRAERRMILNMLENSTSIIEDMLLYKEQWKRAGERLHPSEYNVFPKVQDAFVAIREDKPFETFNSKLEKYIQNGEISNALLLLKTRPGMFARRLDLLLRTSNRYNTILDAFSDVAPSVSSTVLWQVMAHFRERNNQQDIRVFFPKGSVAKAKVIENTLPDVNENARKRVITICRDALLEKYKTLPSLGKVYVSEELKNFTIPFALRSASKSLRTVGRGSRLPFSDGNVIRFFIWWKDGKNRTDIDLSALVLDENSQYKMQIAYYNLRGVGAYHSGDITSAPMGASEFIDLNINKMLKAGMRYVIMSVNSFTRQPFYDLPECFAGFMMRKRSRSGEIYEPRTVENKIDLTADTKICIPFIIDLKERVVIWTDLALKNTPNANNNVLNNMSSLTIMNKAMLSLVKPTLFELFTLHAEARGELVEMVDEADTVFSLKQGITPLDNEKIVGEYL